ncbi:MAG: glycoside hydrolase [Gemmatimonadota bacterium]|nr:glycoside hydrolase [Gemmatimonadota bacterium]
MKLTRSTATIAFAAVAIVGSTSAAQQTHKASTPLAWPELTRDTKPWTRWWWLGSAVDKPNLAAQIDGLAKAGFGGVEVTVIYGAKGADSAYIPYLTPKWVDMIGYTAEEAHRHGMGVDLPQGSGWRTGGPSVQPADVNASLAITIDSVIGDYRWTSNLTGHRVNAITAFSSDGRRVTIPVATPVGVTAWKSPPGGMWMIYIAETRFSGDNVKRPAPGGEGPAIDPFSAIATANYLAMFEQRMAALPRGAIRSYFHDSFEYTGDGSIGLFDYFRAHRGYDLATELPAMTGRGEPDHVARVQSDYRETLSDMLRENFVEQLTRWSHAHGSLMREQAHGSPGNLLDLYAAADIPETEIFGVLGGPDGDPLINKFASSAAHVTGRPLASAESFTWLGEHFSATLDEIKQAADRMFLAGINHLIYHGTSYSPADVAWPGWEFYASNEFNSRNAFWHDLPAFNQYVGRVQSLMQAGEPDNDVLLYWPIFDSWHAVSRSRMDFRVHSPLWFHDKPFGKLARTLHESGVGIDYISDRQLDVNIAMRGGLIRSTGATYSAIVIPHTDHMPPETLARLITLARGGATVVFVGGLPADVPGYGNLAGRRAQLATLTHEVVLGASDRGVRVAAIGKGRVLVGDEIEMLLSAANVHRDGLAEQAGLQVIRRRSAEIGGKERQYFMLASRPIDRWMPLTGSPTSVTYMDPMLGRTGLAQLRTANGRTEAYVQLDSGQSMILRTFSKKVSGAPWPYAHPQGPPVALSGKWAVSFIDGGPVLPHAFTSDLLTAWTGRGDTDADRFAGTARYVLAFDAPDNVPRHVLALGRVAESARVRLNGRELGVLFANPYTVETGPLRKTGNVLEVEVTNLSANRIRDLDQRGVQWRNFKDINLVGIDYKPFDASKWPVRVSGLLGPVTLQPEAAAARPPATLTP